MSRGRVAKYGFESNIIHPIAANIREKNYQEMTCKFVYMCTHQNEYVQLCSHAFTHGCTYVEVQGCS